MFRCIQYGPIQYSMKNPFSRIKKYVFYIFHPIFILSVNLSQCLQSLKKALFYWHVLLNHIISSPSHRSSYIHPPQGILSPITFFIGTTDYFNLIQGPLIHQALSWGTRTIERYRETSCSCTWLMEPRALEKILPLFFEKIDPLKNYFKQLKNDFSRYRKTSINVRGNY